MTTRSPYWFPAKRYGWGWGPPSTWQGWVVMALFTLFLLGGASIVLPAYGPFVFVAYSTCLCAVLIAVCWMKGERPSWRPRSK